jgi:hypothetical protein
MLQLPLPPAQCAAATSRTLSVLQPPLLHAQYAAAASSGYCGCSDARDVRRDVWWEDAADCSAASCSACSCSMTKPQIAKQADTATTAGLSKITSTPQAPCQPHSSAAAGASNSRYTCCYDASCVVAGTRAPHMLLLCFVPHLRTPPPACLPNMPL